MLRRLKYPPMKTLWARMMMKMKSTTIKLTSLKLPTTSDLRSVVAAIPTKCEFGCQHHERLSASAVHTVLVTLHIFRYCQSSTSIQSLAYH